MNTADVPFVLECHNLGKCYAETVLSGVDLRLPTGQVQALLGANGAGKSTLSRIIAGLIPPTTGTMLLHGAPYAPRGKRDAEQRGVQIVQQELNLIDSLSVAENLRLNSLPHRLGLINRRLLRESARRALSRVGLEDLDPDQPAGQLGVGQQQLVEIASALDRDIRLLILDEPTAALTAPEIDRLFLQVGQLRNRGVSVLYISHRLEEIRRICDAMTVLRDGCVVFHSDSAGIAARDIVTAMVGHDPSASAAPSAGAAESAARYTRRSAARVAAHATEDATDSRPELLAVEGLCRGRQVRQVDLRVRAGEIVGIAGLVGAGRSELLRTIFGADRAQSGRIRLSGARHRNPFRHPAQAVEAGLGFVGEDRKRDGLLMPLSIRKNLSIGNLARVSSAAGVIDRRRETQAVAGVTSRMQVRSAGSEQPVEQLSGGNQQKIVLGRWLLSHARVLLLDEPTRGVDVHAKQLIHDWIRERAASGCGLLLVSSELEELLELSESILVMSRGRIVRRTLAIRTSCSQLTDWCLDSSGDSAKVGASGDGDE